MSRPASPGALFFAFTRLALQGFGGVLAVAQRELVERLGWMNQEEFVETLAIAQVLPGPNVVNLSMMVGDRFFGVRGAVAALGGMLAAPALVVLVLAAAFQHLGGHPVAVDALRGMGAVAAGLIVATGIKLLPALHTSPLGRLQAVALALTAFVLIAWLRWPLITVLTLLGGGGIALAWWKLRP
ncbi:chromate transporter [Roseateles sp. DC23W]|uniref:Chromate transporter n=1 Tax=Pelomonas dachongensis TaxID=3299029 RepID=A0ABW7EKA3_9BURK